MQIFAEITPDAVEHTQEAGKGLSGGEDSFTCNSEATLRSNHPCDLPITMSD